MIMRSLPVQDKKKRNQNIQKSLETAKEAVELGKFYFYGHFDFQPVDPESAE